MILKNSALYFLATTAFSPNFAVGKVQKIKTKN